MDYNTTETINVLAVQVARLLEQALTSREPSDRPIRLDQAESQLREMCGPLARRRWATF